MNLDEVAAAALGLPEATETTTYGRRGWAVGGKVFAWERSFSKADVKRFAGAPVPAGPIVAVRTDDLQDKEAVLAQGIRGVFTIPHFDGYAAVLVQLPLVPKRAMRTLLVDGWLAVAPPAHAQAFLARPASRRR